MWAQLRNACLDRISTFSGHRVARLARRRDRRHHLPTMASPRSPFAPLWSRRVAPIFGSGIALVGFLACSRTGLLGDLDQLPDATVPTDARIDRTLPPEDAEVVKPKTCVPGNFNFDRASSQVLFVIDRSGSMRFSLDGRQQSPPEAQSRWRTLERALTPLLRGLESSTSQGATFFPGPQDELDPEATACLVPTNVLVPAALNTAQLILDVFSKSDPLGGTPTAEAVRAAAGFLAAAERRYVARFLVIATDGAPNCNANNPVDPRTCVCTSADPRACTQALDVQNCLDADNTVKAISDALSVVKVPSYVIGIGSSNSGAFEATLDRMAEAGGRAKPQSPKYLQATTESELDVALDTIRSAVSKCVFVTPSRPDDPDAIVVNVNGVPVSRDTSRVNGWDWLDQEYGALSFYGPACDALTAATGVGGTVTCRDAGAGDAGENADSSVEEAGP